ncbi:MAG: hypothetical protein CMF62_00350 [Magnetococcales bacterium]|nr:hypothetical protein [Magnetococcales bacterium]|tara:strand:+ start:18779 stop:19360 length:582 start_codon:yes stop_codon:yes gene_type:complete
MNRYLIILDFEATCKEGNGDYSEQEIIQIGSVLYDYEKKTIIDTFSEYCKPTINPVLSDFCVKLTGITQKTVDKSDEFDIVFLNYIQWLISHKLINKYGDKCTKFKFVTVGDSDLKKFLPRQLKHIKMLMPSYFRNYIDIRKPFRSKFKQHHTGLKSMMKFFNLKSSGKNHNALVDCVDTCNVLVKMQQKNAI